MKLLQQLQEKLEGYGDGAKALLLGKMQGELVGKEFAPIARRSSTAASIEIASFNWRRIS